MRRYTTPTLTLYMPTIDFEGVTLFRVALKRGNDKVIKNFNVGDSEINVPEHKLVISLTQAETALLSVGIVEIQARAKYRNGTVIATDKALVPLREVIDEVEM